MVSPHEKMVYVLFFFTFISSISFVSMYLRYYFTYVSTPNDWYDLQGDEGAMMREGGGYEERGKACESGQLQVDVGAEVQSSERHQPESWDRCCVHRHPMGCRGCRSED
jgi:hypothetical protein